MSDAGVTRARTGALGAAALGATALVLLLTACGQRGPLYLPKKTRTEITPAAPAAPTAPADPDSKPQDDGTAAAPASPSSPPSAP